jgi:hypothetical protein
MKDGRWPLIVLIVGAALIDGYFVVRILVEGGR